MKALKITLALVAVLLLTVSGVKSDTVVVNTDEPAYQEQTSYDLLAHSKKKIKIKGQG